MDFDYQKIKDAESQQREDRLSAFPIHHPIPKPRQYVAPENKLTANKPPVKPRRSIKCRPTAQRDTEEGQQTENETSVKRIDPALVLGPMRPLEALTPSLRANTLLWFERTQLPRLHMPGQPLPCWLHGFATRREAEQLLQDKPQGCFLVRLSETKIGFVLSYRGEDRCRHFIIEEEENGASGGVYLIAGENSRHRSLETLITFYTHNPVGPFNELLTVPCMQPNGGFEEMNRWRMKDRETEVNGTAIDQEENTKVPMAIGPAVLNPLTTNPSNQIPSATEDSVQYAAVRKPLKKTYSLPECKCGPETAPPGLENSNSELAERPSNLSLTVDQILPVDAPYARVNKPPRSVSENTPNFSTDTDLPGMTAAFTPPSISNFDTTAADPKYWKLEPMHTYEETPHTRGRPEEIDCYAVGWRRQAAGLVNLPKNHLYSEVNIRGAQESHAVPRPSLPLRPPPRSTQGPSRTEITGQSFGVPLLMAQPQYSAFHHSEQEASLSSIYEQIPDRSTSSRPSLPPPNPKR